MQPSNKYSFKKLLDQSISFNSTQALSVDFGKDFTLDPQILGRVVTDMNIFEYQQPKEEENLPSINNMLAVAKKKPTKQLKSLNQNMMMSSTTMRKGPKPFNKRELKYLRNMRSSWIYHYDSFISNVNFLNAENQFFIKKVLRKEKVFNLPCIRVNKGDIQIKITRILMSKLTRSSSSGIKRFSLENRLNFDSFLKVDIYGLYKQFVSS